MLQRLSSKIASIIPPECAHQAALWALQSNLFPLPSQQEYPLLQVDAMGMRFSSPLGLSAGFDKNGDVYHAMLKRGFAFVEIGTVTPQPQRGNPKPRIWRLPESQAVINRLGFNNTGAKALEAKLPAHGNELPGIVGINIGKNKDTENALDDYLLLLNRFYTRASYITANISSPNTPGLRDLQKREFFEVFTRTLRSERDGLAALHGRRLPLLIKIAPDVTEQELEIIVSVAITEKIDGLIIGNTTISRPASVISQHVNQQGGLSGRPLFALSTEVLRRAAKLSQNQLTLIGVGGISSAEDVIVKIRAGASLVQLYTALVYEGFGLPLRINAELSLWMQRVGIASFEEIRGIDVR
ncbi:MAG: quinone-dependent dihydroorotate dehydrogenase [Rickettsiales bacterium]|nr:quinone-dependent dihydroorotate dehydrogenase [Rickettsiales bacterium]